MTDQSTGQKIQIVTALEQGSGGKQQFILANADYSTPGKVILAKQEASSPGKVILAAPDGSGVNQLLFASPDLSGQQIQVEALTCTTNDSLVSRCQTVSMEGSFYRLRQVLDLSINVTD